MKPDRIVVGTDNPPTTELLRVLYEPFNRNHDRVISRDVRSVELTKYAASAMLATKISFMNELANIAERVGQISMMFVLASGPTRESAITSSILVRAYDPEAMEETRRLYPDADKLTLCKSATEALEGADVLVIVTEWQEFRSPDFGIIKKELTDPVIFDG